MHRLTPLEIQGASFPTRLRGYDPEAVRDFLRTIAEQVEEEAKIRGELKAQVELLSRQLEEYRSQAEALNEALIAAQKTAEATIQRAEAEAHRTVTEAQALADRIVEEARQRAEAVEMVIAQLRSQRRAARADLKRLSELLAGLVKDDETAERRESESASLTVLRPRTREPKPQP
ncbi:MAG: DivIVA domain-containing protein [Thermoanaerobaculum sp.]|nr:DivIVA domain-containing protein [Thermoanaerobaculum sp.]MCX7894353.1 DivIVA domain-containing protein [Thermoanaerobaculum sp.]MDW7966821.1 DivIVA domain-containing protein [Thermoanaerobaculum sp.]